MRAGLALFGDTRGEPFAMSFPASRGVSPVAHRAHAAQDGYECSPIQNRKFIKNIMRFLVIMGRNVFNVWPKTTLLLPMWPRDAKRLDTPVQRPLRSSARGPAPLQLLLLLSRLSLRF